MAAIATIRRRYRRDTDEMPLNVTVERGRRFFLSIPDGVPYDNEDSDRIYAELLQLRPAPDEIQMPVADGLGGLVCETFMLEYWQDNREDYEIMLDFEDAVRRGLPSRAFREHAA